MRMQLKVEIYREYQEWGTVFWVSLILNLLAYLGYIVHFTYAVDDYGYFFTNVNHLTHGRWVSGFIFNTLLQKSLMPTLSPIFGMTCYVLTGIGLCKLWSVTKRSSLLIIALWSLHPYMLETYTFRIATVTCAIAYLITIIALWLVPRGKSELALAIVLFYLALSTYQTVLGFAVAVIMVQVLLITFRENFSADSIRKCGWLLFRYILMLIISLVVYLSITKLLFLCLDLTTNSRYQAGFISNMDQLKVKLGTVAIKLFIRLGPIKEFVLPFVGKFSIFLIYITAMFAIIKKDARLSVILPVFLWIFLIPLGAIIFLLPLVALNMPWRVCMGLVVFLAGMFALIQESDSLMLRRAGMVLGGFLIVIFILNNNTILFKHHLVNQNDMLMANRIIAKAQSLEGYQPGGELAIVGTVQKEKLTKTGKDYWQIVTEYTKRNIKRRYSLTRSAFETNWSKYSFLLDYCNLELKRCSLEALEKAKRLAKNKKPWPDPSSVFIHDGTVVVVLSLES